MVTETHREDRLGDKGIMVVMGVIIAAVRLCHTGASHEGDARHLKMVAQDKVSTF